MCIRVLGFPHAAHVVLMMTYDEQYREHAPIFKLELHAPPVTDVKGGLRRRESWGQLEGMATGQWIQRGELSVAVNYCRTVGTALTFVIHLCLLKIDRSEGHAVKALDGLNGSQD